MLRKFLPSFVLFLLAGLSALAQEKKAKTKTFELVPKTSEVSIFLPNLTSLAKKGDELYAKAKIRNQLRLSQLFDTFVLRQIGVAGLVDKTQPGGLILVAPESDPKKRSNNGPTITIAVTDLNKTAERFGLTAKELKSGKVFRSQSKFRLGFFSPSRKPFLLLRNKHLYLFDEEAVGKRITGTKSLQSTFTKKQSTFCDDADVLLHYDPSRTGFVFFGRDLRRDLERQAKKEKHAETKQTLLRTAKLIDAVKLVLARGQVKDGVNIRFFATFAKKAKKETQQLLKLLRGGSSPSSVAHLPKGNVLAAQAMKANGVAAAMLIPKIGQSFWLGWFSPRGPFSEAERPLFEGFLEDVVSRLEGFRTALYLTDDPEKGLVSGVAILETDNAKKFLAEMKELAHIADGSNLKFKKPGQEKGIDVDKLIKDLANTRYRTRARARFKLQLLGSKALPYLKKAAKSDDAQVATVARQMLDNIQDRLDLARKQLKSDNPLRKVRPTLALIPNAEKRLGYDVSILRLKLPKGGTKITKQLESYLGPDWKNVRLAVHKNQIVMLVGSDVKLFEKTLRNLKENKLGLAAEKSMARYYKLTQKDRHFELHISTPNWTILTNQYLRNPPTPSNDPFPLTSGSLGLGTDYVQLDVRFPVEELRKMAALYRW